MGIAALALGAAVWVQLAMLPTWAHRGGAASWVLTAAAIGALGLSAWAALRDSRRAAVLAAGVFPALIGLSALCLGRTSATGSDPLSRVLGGMTAALYMATVAAWDRSTRETVPASILSLASSGERRRASPPLRRVVLAVLAAMGFGIGVVAPAVIVSPSVTAGLRASRSALVLAGSLALAIAILLTAGNGLLRATAPRERSASRAFWLMAGAASGVLLWRWLSRER